MTVDTCEICGYPLRKKVCVHFSFPVYEKHITKTVIKDADCIIENVDYDTITLFCPNCAFLADVKKLEDFVVSYIVKHRYCPIRRIIKESTGFNGRYIVKLVHKSNNLKQTDNGVKVKISLLEKYITNKLTLEVTGYE